MEKVGAVNIRIPKNTLIDSCFFLFVLKRNVKTEAGGKWGKESSGMNWNGC